MTTCLCGCGGEPAMGRYLRGHSRRGLLPYQRPTHRVPKEGFKWTH